MRIAIAVVALLALALPAAAEDEVILKSRQSLKGTVVSETDQEVRIRTADGEFIIPRSQVLEVKRDGAAGGKAGAAQEEPAAPPDVIRLKADGKEIRGKIIAEDDSTITMKVGETTLGFDKAVVQWYRKDGQVHQLSGEAPAAPQRPEGRRPPPGPGAEPSPALKRWIAVCMQHLGSEDPGVQRSAGMALRGAGPAARPALEAASQSDDPRVAAAAKRLLESAGRGMGGQEGRQGAGNRRGDFQQRMAEQLELTDDQKPKVAAILEDTMAKQRELFQQMRDGTVPREEVRAKMQEIRDASMTKLSEVLTEEQMAKYREMSTRRGRGGGGRGGGGGGGGRIR